MEPAEVTFVLRQRAVAAAHPLPRRVDVDVHEHRRRVLAQRLAHHGRGDGAAAEAQHGRRLGAQLAHGHLLLAPPERGLAVLAEEGRRVVGHLGVDVHEPAADPLGDGAPERRLPCAHEADEGQVLLQMRSMYAW